MFSNLFSGMKSAQKVRAGDSDSSLAKQRAPSRDETNRVAMNRRAKDPHQDTIPSPPHVIKNFVLWDRSFKRKKFGDIAKNMGYLSEDVVEKMLKEQSSLKKDVFIGDIAIARGVLTPQQVKDVLGYQRLVIYVDDRHAGNPAFLSWMSDLRSMGFDVFPQPSTVQELSKLKESGIGVSTDNRDSGLNTLASAKRLIGSCAAMGGADMHVLVREGYCEVQLRIKGALKVVTSMSRQEGDSMIRSIYTGMTSVKEPMVNPFEFQDAQISGDALRGTGLTSIRIIRGPCFPVEQGGQFMVARLQGKQTKGGSDAGMIMPLHRKVPTIPPGEFRLSKMGYTKKQIDWLEKMARMSSGVILITGPTGSGKTSTLFEMMAHQARLYPELRQVTIENPVEYPMSWAVQMPVTGAKNDEESGSQFLNMIRMSLRMDPDIILLGEIRGGDEATAAIQAAMTGHLVWSTIHVTDPYMAIDRMESMDRTRLARQIICDHKLIRGIIAQRLVPILCEKCKEPVTNSDLGEECSAASDTFENAMAWWDFFSLRNEPSIMDQPEPTFYKRGAGCPNCNGDSVTGVRAVAEVVFSDSQMMRDFVSDGTDAARQNHRAKIDSDYSMLGNAMLCACKGMYDLQDVERSIDIIVRPDQE